MLNLTEFAIYLVLVQEFAALRDLQDRRELVQRVLAVEFPEKKKSEIDLVAYMVLPDDPADYIDPRV